MDTENGIFHLANRINYEDSKTHRVDGLGILQLQTR